MYCRILLIISLCRMYGALKIYERLASQQGKGLFVHHNFQDGRLLYTTCDTNDDKSELKCDVFREKSAYQNDTYKCGFSLNSEQQNGTVDFKTTLDGFGDDKVLIGWQDIGEDNKYIKYSIITLKSCKTSVMKFLARKNQSLHDYQVLIYNDKFDVIYRKNALRGEKLCRMTLDFDGSIMSGPDSFFDNVDHSMYFEAVKSNSSTQRYFFVRRKKDETSYNLVDSGGSTRILTGIRNILPPYHVTTSHNLFGLCYTLQLSSIFDTEIKCAQYDHEGNIKLEMTTKDLKRTKMMRYMHNLRGGGFLFVDEDYANCEPNYCRVGFVAEKWNIEGRNIGSLDLGVRCNGSKARARTSFFENENNDYCFGWTCRMDDLVLMNVTVKCFNDTDFL